MPDAKTAHLTVDVVMLTKRDGDLQVLLIQRGWPPYQGRWAIPGGYVDGGETFDAAARRELREETGLDAPSHLERLDVYGDPGRYPRGRVVTVAYIALLPDMPAPKAGDDAADARWMPVADVLVDPDSLAFDHGTILRDAIERVRPRLDAGRL